MIRVQLPKHLRTLAELGDGFVELTVEGDITQRTLLDALEARYPVLRGTIRDHDTKQRRAYVRFFACEEDLSHEPPDAPLPEAVVAGREPFMVVGAMAGGWLATVIPSEIYILGIAIQPASNLPFLFAISGILRLFVSLSLLGSFQEPRTVRLPERRHIVWELPLLKPLVGLFPWRGSRVPQ